jgi:hypothetical protein
VTENFDWCRHVFEAWKTPGFEHRAASKIFDEYKALFRVFRVFFVFATRAAMSSVSGDFTKPSMKKLLRWTLRIRAVCGVMARA